MRNLQFKQQVRRSLPTSPVPGLLDAGATVPTTVSPARGPSCRSLWSVLSSRDSGFAVWPCGLPSRDSRARISAPRAPRCSVFSVVAFRRLSRCGGAARRTLGLCACPVRCWFIPGWCAALGIRARSCVGWQFPPFDARSCLCCSSGALSAEKIFPKHPRLV